MKFLHKSIYDKCNEKDLKKSTEYSDRNITFVNNYNKDSFEFKIFDNPKDMKDAIEKNIAITRIIVQE